MQHNPLPDGTDNALSISPANPEGSASVHNNGLSRAEVGHTDASSSMTSLATGQTEQPMLFALSAEPLTANSHTNNEQNRRKTGILQDNDGIARTGDAFVDMTMNTGDQLSRSLPPHEKPQQAMNGKTAETEEQSPQDRQHNITTKESNLRLSPAKLYELISFPKVSPLQTSEPTSQNSVAEPRVAGDAFAKTPHRPNKIQPDPPKTQSPNVRPSSRKRSGSAMALISPRTESIQAVPLAAPPEHLSSIERPWYTARAFSTPVLDRKQSSNKIKTAGQPSLSLSRPGRSVPTSLDFETAQTAKVMPEVEDGISSPSIPIPPLSFPAYLHLELSSGRPPPHYIYRSASSDFPYESSRVKIERLLNFLFLPPALEQCLWFGALACLDAWLYTFTILPLRFLKAISMLGGSWVHNLAKETIFVSGFVYMGLGRLWRRGFGKLSIAMAESSTSHVARPKEDNDSRTSATPTAEHHSTSHSHPMPYPRQSNNTRSRHRRTKSEPSALLPEHKADILKGLLIILTCTILMYFDASMMYHSIRGQATIKLYVIYNVLEVCDRLLSALGQDVLECLFSKESLERKPDGRSKVLRPFWLFNLALIYSLLHSTALFYQVITLNVAVNSYSNALLTLLMSNQFVEIKSSVFKKFEKENLFQLTCADVVERFQLWLMVLIIASRNIIETNGLREPYPDPGSTYPSSTTPLRSASILPFSFTIFPDWVGQVVVPFLFVLGTETLVDWLKHAYITKFNNVKPNIYGRFLDIIAKDYYTDAFADQNLTRRLGLPVIPLSCLFIRASVQTYHMFLATHLPEHLPSPATALTMSPSAYSSPATIAALSHVDAIFPINSLYERLLNSEATVSTYLPSYLGAYLSLINLTTLTIFAIAFLLLLTIKLLLGMMLLSYARSRYMSMKTREAESRVVDGKRAGGWGIVEVGEEKRKWIYEDDPEGLRNLKEREARGKLKEQKEREENSNEEPARRAGGNENGKESGLARVRRYSMVAKRIW